MHPLTSRHRLLWPLLTLLACSLRAHEASAAAPEPDRELVLVATGPNNALPERYLRALCELLKSEPVPRTEYASVAIYRTSSDLADIAHQLASNPGTEANPDRRHLEKFAEEYYAGKQYCLKRPRAVVTFGEQISPTRLPLADFIQAEWLPDSSMRVQSGRIDDDGFPSLDEVHYVDLGLAVPEVAKAIALATIRRDIHHIIDGPPILHIAGAGRCAPSDLTQDVHEEAACVLVGQRADISISTRNGDHWVSPERLNFTIEEQCRPDVKSTALEYVSSDQITLGSVVEHTLHYEAVTEANCELALVVSAVDAPPVRLPLARSLKIRRGGLPLETDPRETGLPPRLLESMTIHAATLRIAPFIAVQTTNWTFRPNPSFLDPVEAATLESEVILAFELHTVLPEDQATTFRNSMLAYMKSRQQRLAADVRNVGHFCERATRVAYGPGPIPPSWIVACRSVLQDAVDKFMRAARSRQVQGFVVRTETAEHTSAIPTALLRPVEWTSFTGAVSSPDSGPERYVISMVDKKGQQSVPFEGTVVGNQKVVRGLGVRFGPAVGRMTFADGYHFGGGGVISVFGNFLEILSADVDFLDLFHPTGANSSTSVSAGNATRISIGGNVRLGGLLHLFDWFTWINGTPDLILDLGGGYTFVLDQRQFCNCGPNYPYLSANAGWRLGVASPVITAWASVPSLGKDSVAASLGVQIEL